MNIESVNNLILSESNKYYFLRKIYSVIVIQNSNLIFIGKSLNINIIRA